MAKAAKSKTVAKPAANPAAARSARGKPTRSKNPLRTFTLWVALPTAIVYLGGCALVMLALHAMSSEMNRIEAERGRNAIAAAIQSVVLALGEGVADEATWTEAYINTYVQPNPAWLDSAWGATARISDSYDTAIVTDVDGNITFGETSRGPMVGTLAEHFSGAAEMLTQLDASIARIGDDATVEHLAHNDLGVVAIAGAVIHGNTGQASIPKVQRRILWLARQVDEKLLDSTTDRFQLPTSRLVEHPEAGADSMPLIDATGQAVSTIAWQPRRPGDPAFAHTATIAFIIMLICGALTFAVLAAFRSSIRSRAESDERDWYNVRYDEVTDLYNQLGLEESLRSLIPKRRNDTALAAAQIGIDGFTEVVGSYGRDAGDQLLVALADRFEALIEDRVYLARTGPAEFTIAQVGDDGAALVHTIAAKLQAGSGGPVSINELQLRIGLSVGLAEAGVSRDTVGDVLRNAETALARARETGGGHLVKYDSSIEDERRRRLSLQADIRRGLEASEFDLEYQPIIDFTTQSIVGVEALMRWTRRAGGAMGPGDFIPAAEASGLIDDLGMFALRRALEDIGPLGELKISVNVSGMQLRNPGLPETVIDMLHEWGVAAGRLQLEVTETFLVAHPDRAKRALDALRAEGIAIALDDFGTGYSSIGYLRQFQFDRVKLDRSIVADIDRDQVQAALVESTVTYAYAMGLSVTAEGVERREEAVVLQRLGCREFQGYLFARPMSLDRLTRLLDTPARKAS
ncbi:putative bifunctional diguanylate cyclase/phosphodiesterase [Devosia sp.]|uniref:putative bifunctional diguanylate cyclase/phosphodiesterase n=1 Tax=Devosia sp. TaxID=1871048 RepID=UPI003BAA908A